MTKADRLIFLLSFGILIASVIYIISNNHRENVSRNNAWIEERNKNVSDTFDIRVWKTYHEREMALLSEILIELRKRNEALSTKTL